MKKKENIKRGKNNRRRGADLQRRSVSLAKSMELDAFNRDRGGAQHEMGDVEIEEKFYGCKRRKKAPQWIFPEKQEIGVIFKADYKEPYISIKLEHYLMLLSLIKQGLADGQTEE